MVPMAATYTSINDESVVHMKFTQVHKIWFILTINGSQDRKKRPSL